MSGFNRSNWQQRALLFARTIPYLGPRLLMVALRFKLNKSVTLQKTKNFILANHEADLKAIQVKSLPYILNIDSINACNLKCPFCATGTNQLDRKQTRIPTEKAKALIDKVKSHVLLARFHNWGEPFLNKDIFSIIRHAKDAGIFTTTSSNLSVDVDNLAQKIIDSGLDHIHVSIDGLEQQTLETYRRKASIDLVYKNIKDIVALKKKLGLSTPRLELTFLVFKHNEHEIPRLDEMKQSLGVDSFVASNAFIYHDSFIPNNSRFKPSQTIWKDSCHYLYSELMVESDGAVSPCCTNTSSQFDVGNISEIEDLNTFWNKPIFQAMRSKGSEQAVPKSLQSMTTLCDSCEYIDTGKTKTNNRLSPYPPAINAKGETLHHGLDDIPIEVS